jgi:hypothetical protein
VPVELNWSPALRDRVAALEALPLFGKYYLPFDAPVPVAAPATGAQS